MVRMVDLNGDGLSDRMYTSDLGGQIWRFDIFGGNAPNGIGPDALVTGGVIAQLGAEGLVTPTNVDTRRFYNTPDISIFNDNIQQVRSADQVAYQFTRVRAELVSANDRPR